MSRYPCAQHTWLPAVAQRQGLLWALVSEALEVRLQLGVQHGEYQPCQPTPVSFVSWHTERGRNTLVFC